MCRAKSPIFTGMRWLWAAVNAKSAGAAKSRHSSRILQSDQWRGLPVTLRRVEDVGRHRIIRAEMFGSAFNLIAPEGMAIGADMTRVAFAPDKINVFADDWRVGGAK
jgi:hypothetical protein